MPGAIKPPNPWERDLDRMRREIMSEVARDIEGLSNGLNSHIEIVVKAAVDKTLAPYAKNLAKLDVLLELAQNQERREEEKERKETEKKIREELEEQRKREEAHVAALLEQRSKAIDIIDKRVDGNVKRRNVVIGFAVTVLGILTTLIGAMIGSRSK